MKPLTAAEVRDKLGGDLAYTTVLTTLTRLFEKGALRRNPRGRAFEYELVGGKSGFEANLAANRMRTLLGSGTDRASILSRFVDGLTDEDEATLRTLLAEHVDDEGPGTDGRASRKSP